MRTFEQYIEESVDFRLGGSNSKGVAAPKSFEELEKGDYLYYWNFADSGSKLTLRLGFGCRITYINKSSWHNITIKYVAEEEGNEKYLDSDTLYVYDKKRNNSMILLSDFDDVNAVEIMTTYRDAPEHILATAEEMLNEIITNESVNFRLGGSSNKDWNLKTFRELKPGDKFFRALVKTSGMKAVSVPQKQYSMDVIDVKIYDEEMLFGTNENISFVVPVEYSEESEYVLLSRKKHENLQGVYSTYRLSDEELMKVVNNAMKNDEAKHKTI